MIQNLTEVPDDWFVNCTPGGTFSHLAKEIDGVGIPPSVQRIVVVCGTNYDENLGGVAAHIRTLISAIRRHSSPTATVRI